MCGQNEEYQILIQVVHIITTVVKNIYVQITTLNITN